jgi:alginate O-acetyltransferase complex protein AlgI
MYTVRWYVTPELWLALVAGAIGSTPWVPAIARRLEQSRQQLTLEVISTATLVTLLVVSAMHVAARTYNPFIYFRF